MLVAAVLDVGERQPVLPARLGLGDVVHTLAGTLQRAYLVECAYAPTLMENGLEAAAEAADRDDPAPARDRFAVTEVAYFAGNSLGLMPIAARAALDERMDQWHELAVEAWFESGWLEAGHDLAPAMARVVGARPSEVAIAGSLTQNLHFLLAALYHPSAERYRILIDADAFPSDQYAAATHVAWHGLDPTDAVIHGNGSDVDDSVAVTLLAGASYISGEVADMEALTARAHEAGAIAIWDLAHAAGNVPVALHDWNVDAAAWCGYKYLNGGPGAPAAMFVAERHSSAPRLAGWWGVAPERRFQDGARFRPQAGCRRLRGFDAVDSRARTAGRIARRV